VCIAALSALLAGCPGGGPTCPNDLPASCPSDAPGYAATIEPLIEKRCWACHGPGVQFTGHPLGTYDQVQGDRSAVLDQVYGCLMPPSDAGQLTSAERKELLGWLKCGALNN